MASHPRFNIITTLFILIVGTTFSIGVKIIDNTWNGLGKTNNHNKAEVVGVMIVLGLIAVLSLLYYGLVLSLIKVTTWNLLSSFITVLVGSTMLIYAATAPPLMYMTIPVVILAISLKALHLSFISSSYVADVNNYRNRVSSYFRRMAIALGMVFLITLCIGSYMDFYSGKNIMDNFSNDNSVSEIQNILNSQKDLLDQNILNQLNLKLDNLKKKDTFGQIGLFLSTFVILLLIYRSLRRLYSGNLTQTQLVAILENESQITQTSGNAI